MLTIAEIMTREPYTLGPDDTLATARQMLAEHHIRHIPIVSAAGALLGVVSQRDVLAAGDTTARGLKGYRRRLSSSFVLKDHRKLRRAGAGSGWPQILDPIACSNLIPKVHSFIALRVSAARTVCI